MNLVKIDNLISYYNHISQIIYWDIDFISPKKSYNYKNEILDFLDSKIINFLCNLDVKDTSTVIEDEQDK